MAKIPQERAEALIEDGLRGLFALIEDRAAEIAASVGGNEEERTALRVFLEAQVWVLSENEDRGGALEQFYSLNNATPDDTNQQEG